MNKITSRFLILALFIAGVNFMAAAITIKPSSNYKTQAVKCSEFSAVCTNTSIDIIYNVGKTKVEVYAPDNVLPYIEIAVCEDELRVNYKGDMTFIGQHKTHVLITAPAVTRFKTNSSGDIKIKDDISLKGKDIELLVNSAGDIEARNIEGRNVTLRTNSAGDIKTESIKANQIKLLCNSAGNIETDVLTAKTDVTVNANSAGDVKTPTIVAGDDVKIHANSAGDIKVDAVLSEKLGLYANSAGDIKVNDVKSTTVTVATNSAGNITVSGICATASMVSNLTGNIKAGDLRAKTVSATVNSLGDISCQALESIQIRKYGHGKVTYTGNPTNVDTNK